MFVRRNGTEKLCRSFQDFCVEMYLRKDGNKFCVGVFDLGTEYTYDDPVENLRRNKNR